MIHNYSLLPGSKTFWINDLPALLPVAALIGAYVAHRVRAPHPGEAPHIADEATGPHVTTAEAPALAG
jgi:hypothetical protein